MSEASGLVLRTRRMVLRPYRRGEAEALHALFTEPGFRKWLFDGQIVPRSFVEKEMAAVEQAFQEHGWGQWSIRRDEEGPLIGIAGLRHFHKPPRLELFYGLSSDHWGRGLAAEAATAVLRHCFETLGMHKVVASTDAPHTRSVRVLEKLGMRFVERSLIDGLDTLTYVIARGDFGSGPGTAD